MTRPRPIVAAHVAIAFSAGLVACSGGGATTPPSATPALVVADAPSIPASVDALPPIDADGYEAIVADARGTPLVVNFWASWCEPCEEEIPMLADAAREHGGVQFLGVDILDTPGDARAFLARHLVPYPNLFDVNGRARDSVGSLGQPVTVFYAADGTLAAKVDGALSAQTLADHLAEIAP